MINIVVDLETTANGPNNSPEAHYLNNKVLLCGWREVGGPINIDSDVSRLCHFIRHHLAAGKQVRLIGHNIKFDLKYLMRYEPTVPWDQVDVWCTQYTHYRLTGHRSRMVSLEDVCGYNGIPFQKSLNLGALIASGIKPEQIDRDELAEYLEEDVDNTCSVWEKQTRNHPYTRSIFQNHLLVLADMELNGLPIDRKVLQANSKAALICIDSNEEHIKRTVKDLLEWDNGDEITEKHIKWTAPRTISYLLTGEPRAGLTKLKTKAIVWQKGKGPLLSQAFIQKIWKNKKPTNLGYSLSKHEIEAINTHANTIEALDLIAALEGYRHYNKLMGTYYGPFAEDMDASGQNTIHPKLNHAVTATGRLSSSSPNGQNMPTQARSLVRATHASIMEIDFSQLEVVALATLSKDKQLMIDIKNGEDIHFNTGKRVMGWKTPADMTKDQRKIVKNVNFGLIYGGGAAGLAYQTGQPKKLVQQLIDSFYLRYPGVKQWQTDVYTEIAKKMQAYRHSKTGEQVYHSMYECPVSGRRYHFVEDSAPPWLRKKTGRAYSFKPTETKNYPVQGFAGGDIVMAALWELWTSLYRTDTTFRLTVHDSILIDTSLTEQEVRDAMNNACRVTEALFHIPFELKFDIDKSKYWS